MYRVPGIIGIALIASSACSGDEPVEPPRFPPDPAIVRLEAQPELAMLRAGQTLQLTLRAWDQHGDEVSQPAVQWVSAQPQHARIDGDGTVTGESRGTALIIVASGEARDSVYVKVDEVAWVAIVLGNYHTCGLALDGAAYCWGQNAYGELGDGTTTDRTRAVRVAGGLRFAALSAEWEVSCGLTTSAEPYCWGDGTSGSFGTGGTERSSVPVRAAGNISFVSLSVGTGHACGVAAEGTAYCWGNNEWGQLGSASAHTLTPIPAGGGPYRSIDAGGVHTCAQSQEGATYCWGLGSLGEVGDGSNEVRVREPRRVAGNHSFTQVRTGTFHSCAVDTASIAWCWGRNHGGQLGTGTLDSAQWVPTPVVTNQRFTGIFPGGFTTCAVTARDEAWCWGRNERGQLGNGTKSPALVPERVAGSHRFVAIGVSDHREHICGVTRSGDAFCWGSNWIGQLGDGTLVDRLLPVRVLQPEDSAP